MNTQLPEPPIPTPLIPEALPTPKQNPNPRPKPERGMPPPTFPESRSEGDLKIGQLLGRCCDSPSEANAVAT
jgi:hypothetical protein